ncbi:hypothetical protein CVT26_012764 [Gymnopilus dilepis]|uniref:Uncharacterized protein n=1 Tax=Gymnopilus dilepis TaxID=231916 RepID=A0A409WDP9_9AGAR|nr:hypothetical protein CVT26_012764 [Gymnopilus dilepis]
MPVLLEKVYRYPTPAQLVRPAGKGPFYPVTRAQKCGIFNNWQVTGGVPYAIQESRDTWEEAVAVYEAAYNEGTIEVIPLPGTEYENAPYDMKPIKVVREYDPSTTCKYRIPDATSFTKPKYWSRIYVVFEGEEVGLFWTWHQVMTRTAFLKEFRYETYGSNYRLAITQYAIEQKKRTLKVTPRPGGVFDVPVEDSDDN